MSYRGFDLLCFNCGNHKDVLLHRDEFTDENGKKKEVTQPCDKCDGTLEEVWLQAPGVISKEGSTQDIANMKKSFNERFLKKDIDDVRHKHGRLFDDSIKSAAVKRIKKNVSAK